MSMGMGIGFGLLILTAESTVSFTWEGMMGAESLGKKLIQNTTNRHNEAREPHPRIRHFLSLHRNETGTAKNLQGAGPLARLPPAP